MGWGLIDGKIESYIQKPSHSIAIWLAVISGSKEKVKIKRFIYGGMTEDGN